MFYICTYMRSVQYQPVVCPATRCRSRMEGSLQPAPPNLAIPNHRRVVVTCSLSLPLFPYPTLNHKRVAVLVVRITNGSCFVRLMLSGLCKLRRSSFCSDLAGYGCTSCVHFTSCGWAGVQLLFLIGGSSARRRIEFVADEVIL